MFEPKLISPMLDNFVMGAPISEHHGIRCCPAMPEGTDQRYIVKIISIPASQTQLDALLLTGAYPDEEAAVRYFASVADDIKAEVEILSKLSQNEGFVPFEGCQIVPMDDATGYDVYLLSPYKRSVARFFQKETMTHLKAVNLGLDMCAAMALCRQAGYLYVDLKPENIFVGSDGEYRIGDLGFIKLDSIKYASLPDKYRSSYTAPEVQDVYSSLNTSIDIYAAGLVLYQAYNGGVLPFEGAAPSEALPAPIFADYEMAEIILKACDPDPAQRWANPVQMGQALISYMQRNGANDTPIVPAPVTVHSPAPSDEADIASDEPQMQIDIDAADQASVPGEDMAATIQEQEQVPEPEVPAVCEDANGQICMDGFGKEADEAADASNPDAVEVADMQDTSEQPDDQMFLDSLILDDTAADPEDAQQQDYDGLSQDICDILSQADELIAHDPPEPADLTIAQAADESTSAAEEAAAEDVCDTHGKDGDTGSDVTLLPLPGTDSDDLPVQADNEQTLPADESAEASLPAVETAEDEPSTEAMAEEAQPAQTDGDDDRNGTVAVDDDSAYDYEYEDQPAFNVKKLLAIILVGVLLAGLIFGGYYFYREYYLQSVTSLVLEGNEDVLTVKVHTSVDESLLSVVCVDTYGTKVVQPVVNGTATFTDLNPSTLYSIKVEISGMHKLHGEISDSYSTPVQSTVISLNAVTGSESGSAIISFTVDGSDSGNWLLTYSASGEAEKTHSFSGHMATVTGLTLGKDYSFTLSSADGVFLTGETEVVYTAIAPVLAEDLQVAGNGSDGVRITWTVPEDTLTDGWIVHCYNGSDYNETVTVTENNAEFSGLDFSKAYTIEVTATGMSAGSRFYMSENSVPVSNESATVTAADTITVDWDCAATVSGQWIVQYSVEGLEDQQPVIVRTANTSAAISPIIPNATYLIEIKLENGNTVLSRKLSVTTPEASPFQGHILGFIVKDTPIQFSMCKRPAYDGWSYANVLAYTSTFSTSDRIGLVGYIPGQYNPQNDTISIMYIYRDQDGNIVSCESTSAVWRNMWYRRYCELDAPAVPQTPGSYTLELYFEGYLAHKQTFTVN